MRGTVPPHNLSGPPASGSRLRLSLPQWLEQKTSDTEGLYHAFSLHLRYPGCAGIARGRIIRGTSLPQYPMGMSSSKAVLPVESMNWPVASASSSVGFTFSNRKPFFNPMSQSSPGWGAFADLMMR
ncbi:MAG: hypothetical protein ACI87O_000238 [Planctomycetota bacterium]|jgi:hypothetical protein